MALTVAEMKKKAKEKRSRAITGLINVIKTRDGSVSPPIEGLAEVDEFNLSMLFGSSKNENIVWSSIGVEGLIRLYYDIIQDINGKSRDNNITNISTLDTINSSLDDATKRLLNGSYAESGFFKEVNSRPAFDTTSSSFSDNREDDPAPDTNTIISSIATFITDIIGTQGALGPHTGTSLSTPEDFLGSGLIGRRLSDVCPYTTGTEPLSWTFGNGSYDRLTGEHLSDFVNLEVPVDDYQEFGFTGLTGNDDSGLNRFDNYTLRVNGTRYTINLEANPDYSDVINALDTVMHPDFDCELIGGDIRITNTSGGSVEITDGDNLSGDPDTVNLIELKPDISKGGYEATPDWWNDSIFTELSELTSELNAIKALIEYTKIIDTTYFANTNSIPGYPEWSIQQGWIDTIEAIDTSISDFITSISQYRNQGDTQTNPIYRDTINTLIQEFRTSLINNNMSSIASDIELLFGDSGNSQSMRGLRFLWIKNVIDPNDGSKTALNGLKIAIEMMEANITKAEDEFGLYGLEEDEWIPIPNIAGIQTYYLPNDTTFEMEAVGYLIAWEGQDHVVGYNVWKSTDWDGSTGNWTIILPAGNTYTEQQIDANTGRVLTYYIDESVDILGGSKPFYRVKSYDNENIQAYGTDMYRTPAASTTGDPKNIDDFPEGGETVPAIPGSPPEPPPITVPEIPETVPAGTLIWTTILERDDAIDDYHRRFQSEVPFDSSGTNLVVYVNGELKNRGEDQDYTIIDYNTIEFSDTIVPSEEITLNVFLRNPDEDITSWRDPVVSQIQLPQQANSDGDVRLVIDENAIYQWEGSTNTWILISGATGNNWGAPVDIVGDLPVTGNDGEIRFVITEQSFYYYNGSQGEWINAISTSMQWKDPVSTFGNLPSSGNTIGDVRLVLDNYQLYLYDGTWSPIVANSGTITLNHDDLINMPDLAGLVGDHDARYYTENEIDITVTDLQDQINALLSLIPSDAESLNSTFTYSGTSFHTGYLSHNGGAFVTLSPEQNFSKITEDANFTLLNPEPSQFNDADKGILKLYINDSEVDSFNLGSAFNESERETNQSYPPATGSYGFIEITEIEPYANYPTYQRGEFKIEIISANLVPGENKIKLVHELTEENKETDDFILFWDNDTNQIDFQSISVSHENISSSKYLSGVRHYSLGDQFRISFTSTNLFNNTYSMPNQIKIDPTDFSSSEYYINYQSAGVSGVAQPAVDEILSYESVIPINIENTYKINPRLALIGYDPHGAGDQIYTPYFNILINTHSIKSDDKNEYFVDEHYRLDETANYDNIPASINGLWNSQTILISGQLQVFDNSLVYPSINFNTYLPSQAVNYTGLAGDRYYIRAFKDTNPHNNGSFFIEGYNIESSDVKIELKLSSQTGWLDLSKQYNVAIFSGIDGDGCLINHSGYNFEWTSGGFSTANSGHLIVLKITMIDNVDQISQINIDW